MGCDTASGAGADAGGEVDAASGDPGFLASCVYENTFAGAPECREYRSPGWSEGAVTRDCRRVFLGMAGELRVGEPCAFERVAGRCTVGDLATDGYVIVSSGGAEACGAAQTGCETFAGGTFEADASCDACTATGAEGPGAIVPTTPDCRDPRPGEPPGQSDGRVCTPTLISGSTEEGRAFADYADCGVVRTQRPYYAMPSDTPRAGEDDPRLEDADYLAEVDWVRSQAEASACSCCHSASRTPSGAAVWDTEAGPLWIDTVTDEALAMIAGYTDSAAFGFLEASQNNGFDRSRTGLPTTDVPRLQAFAERELARRGLSVEEAAALPPFAPFFRELIDHVPDDCGPGVGLDDEGRLRWTGGAARYVWVLEAAARSPGVPPNWDLPEGTLWAITVPADASPLGCGMAYGEVADAVIQRVPADGVAPSPLVSGETYYLAVMRDIAQPITRCRFVAP
ncbi:MAG: proteinase inhibitor [Myxococcales bacterium]|nr:proteinase inhibitor [Myxococcales bacterium]